MNQSISLHNNIRDRVIAIAQSVVLIIAALMAAAGASALTQFGYEWGYHVVDKLVRQPSSDQLTGAIMLGFWFVPGITIGIFLGYIEKARKSALWRTLVAPVCVLSIFAPFIYVAIHEGGLSLNEFQMAFGLSEWVCLGAAIVVGYCVNYLARNVYAQLKMRTYAIRLTGSLLLGLFTMLLIDPEWSSNAPLAFSIYVGVLFTVGLVSALVLKVKNARAGWAAALVATLPVTLFDLTNVLFTVTFLLTNTLGFGLKLGWRATLSAVLITMISLIAASLGGIIGGQISRRTNWRTERNSYPAGNATDFSTSRFLAEGTTAFDELNVVNVSERSKVAG